MKKTLLLAFCLSSLVHAAPDSCASSTAQDIVACALMHHPDILRAEAHARQAGALEAAARQRPNPEVDAQSTSFKDSDQPGLKIEASLLHTFELGGKRTQRVQAAKTHLALAQTHAREVKEQVILATVLHLNRLRQLRIEMQTLDESIHTFGKVVEAFRSRSVLSAEQDVSLNVFDLAQSENALRKSALLQERTTLGAYFTVATGLSLEKIESVLPPEPDKWPPVPSLSGPLRNAARQEAETSIQIAKNEHAAASRAAWPDVKAGPRLETESGHGQNSQGYGVALAVPLPFYQRNEGNRRLTKLNAKSAQIELEQKDRELIAERTQWAAIYEQAVATYQQAPGLSAVQKKHHSLERLFERGLVSATLVIEAHRQVTDYVKARHEQELKALEALWSLYVLDGSVFDQRL